MKFKDLEPNYPLKNVKVKLPKKIYKSSGLPVYRIKNVPVYLIGWLMGDIWVKVNKKSKRIYPMFWKEVPKGIDEWEVEIDKNE